MSVLEGVTLLVQIGYSDHFVLQEIPLDVFRDLLIVAQKAEMTRMQHFGMAMTVAVASVLSDKGAKQAREMAQDQMSKLDSAFLGDEEDEEYDGWERQPRPKKPKQKQVERMIRNFHNSFSKLSAMAIPSFDEAMRRAVNEQKRMADVAPKDREG